MDTAGEQPYELPDHPVLRDLAVALRDAGQWGLIADAQWRLVYVTDELRLTFGGFVRRSSWAIGSHFFGPEALRASQDFRFGMNTPELYRVILRGLGGYLLADTAGGVEAARTHVDASLHDVLDELTPDASAGRTFVSDAMGLDETLVAPIVAIRLRDDSGAIVGTAILPKPAAGMAMIGAMTTMGDLRHFERMQRVAQAARRPAAILFADLEHSSRLARRLPTATYFALGRRLVRAADRAVIDAGGVVGRHVGDGVVAFFLSELIGGESAAARACITAARTLNRDVQSVAARSGLGAEDVVLRFGMHWGSTLYVGNISTGGRTEVTALGDAVNEAARIEACATGGRALASKDLVERLDDADASALGLAPDSMSYTPLAELGTATEKARRDAPAVAVCDVGEERDADP